MEEYSHEYQQEKKTVKFDGRMKILTGILMLALILSIGIGAYVYTLYLDAKEKANDPSKVINEQTKDLVDDLSELIVVDEGEDPTIASVIDIEALKVENPEFYKNGKNGHVIFIFPTRVILYDKEEHKIINVAPIINVPETTVDDPSGTEKVEEK